MGQVMAKDREPTDAERLEMHRQNLALAVKMPLDSQWHQLLDAVRELVWMREGLEK